MSATVTLLGCGDVGPVHEPAEAFCTLAKPTLVQADLRFAQVVNGDEVRVS